MAAGDPHPTLRNRSVNEHSLALADEWKRLARLATAVALLTSPILFALLSTKLEWAWYWCVLGALGAVVIFRGLVDVLAHRLIPAPTIYGAESELAADDVISRRRLWYWRKKFRRTIFWGGLFTLASLVVAVFKGDDLGTAMGDVLTAIPEFLASAPQMLGYLVALFLINFLILFGPLVLLGIQQIKGYEPGDADWGVKLEDVRGQAEAKEEITRVVSLWQSGEDFEKAGGKRERGVLFLGPPGTGKTMLSKAIATSFNCPFVTIPGSGFAQTFIGMDAVIVRFLARKAKRLAAKWGGQCIVFIDEIDAVGMRRQSLGAGFHPYRDDSVHDHLFFGHDGALTPDGDLLLETREWRDRLFSMRAAPPTPAYPAIVARLKGALDQFMMPGMGGGGSLALNQLLVVMDGIDDPPLTRKFITNRLNTFLDALYIVPQRIGRVSLRKKPPRPRKEEIYFIGACNVPLQVLDPALTRPGRMGRHIFFRTPTWEDRRDIFDLYITKVDHVEALDTERKRDELARITSGYSPAMIDQVCSMALTYAHSDGRLAVRVGRPARGDDDGRVGRRDPAAVPEARGAGDRDPRGRPCRLLAPLRREPAVDAPVDPPPRQLRRPPRRDGARGALRRLALGADRGADLGARRDGRRARLLRPEHDRRRRRRPLDDVQRGAHGRAPCDGPDARRPLRPDRGPRAARARRSSA